MIDAGPDDRQTERHVHRRIEVEQLQWDQCLIVIHPDHHLELTRHRAMKDGVCRVRAADVDAFAPCSLDRRADQLFLLAAKQPVFTGVGVQAGDGDSRAAPAEVVLEGRASHLNRVQNSLDAQLGRHIFERDVRRQRHVELFAPDVLRVLR